MAEILELMKNWFFGLGNQYGVDPIIFGSIYIGAIPFFMLSVTWLVKSYRRNKSIILPAFCATGCFISAYVYLFIAGKNVPWWVYSIAVLMILYGAGSTYRIVRKKMNKIDNGILSDEQV